jgi:hypothetical protein
MQKGVVVVDLDLGFGFGFGFSFGFGIRGGREMQKSFVVDLVLVFSF